MTGMEGRRKLAHAVYRIFAGSPIQMYERGEIDLTYIGINNIDRARDPANALNQDLREGTNLCTYYLGFNLSQPPFDEPEVPTGFDLSSGHGQVSGSFSKGPVETCGRLRAAGNVRLQ